MTNPRHRGSGGRSPTTSSSPSTSPKTMPAASKPLSSGNPKRSPVLGEAVDLAGGRGGGIRSFVAALARFPAEPRSCLAPGKRSSSNGVVFGLDDRQVLAVVELIEFPCICRST